MRAYHLAAVVIVLALTLSGCSEGLGDLAPTPTPAPQVVIRISGSGTAMPVVEKLAEAYTEQHPTVRFQFEEGTSSGGAIQGVLQHTLDLAVANRPLSADETKQPLTYHAFAQDAVVFAANGQSTLTGLSTTQIQDIYGGRLTDWGQLGGAAAPILVLDRDEDESARTLVLVPLMDGQPVEARTTIMTKAKEMVAALESTPGSLGYSSLGLVRILQPQGIQVLALDGVTPHPDSVTQGAYPWSLTFGLIHDRDAPPAVQDFVAFTLSPAGHQVLEHYDMAPVDD